MIMIIIIIVLAIYNMQFTELFDQPTSTFTPKNSYKPWPKISTVL